MKINISAAIDRPVAVALNKFCEHQEGMILYRRSKSSIVNEALKEYLVRNGVTI